MTVPRNVVVLLLDSLNRHHLGAYGSTEFATPTLDAFAATAVRFTDHHAGSLPCLPARHDLLCGALDFLWKPWGSIELWEEPITVPLRRVGVVTKLVTDHPHLFEVGGENYHSDFTAWDYQRGHESDPWRTRADPSWIGAPSFGRGHTHYDTSRGWFTGEEDFPGPRTMAAAARWLRNEAPADERFFLLVDEFDPHEPFDSPEPYASMYDESWVGSHLIWPPYAEGGIEHRVLTAREGHQVRAQYGAKLTMIDHWVGRVLQALYERGLAADTAVIVCTDHGHYLGERDLWGKPAVPVYAPLGHIPLLVRWPGVEPGQRTQLTTTVDLHATLCDVFAVRPPHRVHGHSLVDVIADSNAPAVRDHLLTGVWGREVVMVTPEARYVRGPVAGNEPLSMWSNRWSTMPVGRFPDLRLPPPDDRAWLDRMPGSTIPVIRQPFRAGDLLPFWAMASRLRTELYDRADDPGETVDRVGSSLEADLAALLRDSLVAVAAPDDHLVRLGLG